jgi:putative PIN family toxin of toxin-antitoxin system
MIRAVVDTNVLVSALLAPRGAPALVVRAWMHGEFELVVSPRLLDELQRVLAYPKLRRRITAAQANTVLDLLGSSGEHHDDPTTPAPVASPDPDDDFLIALAAAASAHLVSGDTDLLGLAPRIPVHDPAAFLDLLADQP